MMFDERIGLLPAADLGVSPTIQRASSGRTTAYIDYAIPPPELEI